MITLLNIHLQPAGGLSQRVMYPADGPGAGSAGDVVDAYKNSDGLRILGREVAPVFTQQSS